MCLRLSTKSRGTPLKRSKSWCDTGSIPTSSLWKTWVTFCARPLTGRFYTVVSQHTEGWSLCACMCLHVSGVWWGQVRLPGDRADEGRGAVGQDPQAEVFLRERGQRCALHHHQDCWLPPLPRGEETLLYIFQHWGNVETFFSFSNVFFSSIPQLTCDRWYTETWSPVTSYTWTTREIQTPSEFVTLDLPSSFGGAMACFSPPVTLPTLWHQRWERRNDGSKRKTNARGNLRLERKIEFGDNGEEIMGEKTKWTAAWKEEVPL